MGTLVLAGTKKGLLLLRGDALRVVYMDGVGTCERDGLDTGLDGAAEVRVIAAIVGG